MPDAVISNATTPATYRYARWLAPGIALLLFAQWPLREFGRGGASVLANDAAQLMFATYVSIAVAWATRRRAHVSMHPAPAASRAAALLPLPWCLWLVATGLAPAWRALLSLEHFPESFNPGYFLLRAAPLLLAGLLLAESVRAWRHAGR